MRFVGIALGVLSDAGAATAATALDSGTLVSSLLGGGDTSGAARGSGADAWRSLRRRVLQRVDPVDWTMYEPQLRQLVLVSPGRPL